MSNRKVGVYVDSMNIMRCGGYGMRYEVIRRFAGRDGDQVMRLNAYVAIDEFHPHPAGFRFQSH
jgi:hypothetical protein